MVGLYIHKILAQLGVRRGCRLALGSVVIIILASYIYHDHYNFCKFLPLLALPLSLSSYGFRSISSFRWKYRNCPCAWTADRNEWKWYDHRSYLSLVISSSEKGQKNSDLNGDSNLDLCDAGAVLFQLSYQAYWELVIMWVYANGYMRINR